MLRACRVSSHHSRHSQRASLLFYRGVPFYAAGFWQFSSLKTGGNSNSNYNRNEGNKGHNGDDDNNNKKQGQGQRLFDAKTFNQQWKSAKDFFDSQVGATNTENDNSSMPNRKTGKESASNDTGIFGMVKAFIGGDAQNGNANSDNDKSVKESKDVETSLYDVQSSLMGLLSGTTSSQSAVEELVSKARNSSEQGDVSDSVSLEELMSILRNVGDEMGHTFQEHLDGQELPPIYPTNLYYYLEEEDEIKNFSWRRRKHRFCRGINFDYVDELNSYARIAEIGYHDEMEAIKEELSDTFGYEVIYCQMDSLPGQPSHFLAVKKEQSSWNSSLDMLLCVRGTKTITDVITDLLANAVDYKDGKAHSGILQSGTFLAEKHLDTFQEFLEASGKKKINLTLVGHSLGAGAASIAGMELHEKSNFDVQVIGFGCPALLSKELSEKTEDFITTVVADNDCIPRMSLGNMINAVLNIGEYNWIPKAKQDIEDLIDQVQSVLPGIITDSVKKNLLEMLNNKVLSTIEIPEASNDRIDPLLFPPGKCIHFYRDGFGLAGAVVPCTFFNELDVNRRMVHDHLFESGYRPLFLDLMRQHTQDQYFQFDVDK